MLHEQPSPRLLILNEVIKEIKKGNPKHKDLQDVINIIKDELEKLAKLQEENIEMDDESTQKWQQIKSAIIKYKTALNTLEKYIKTKNDPLLDEGLNIANEADKELFEVYNFMSTTYKKLKDDLEAKDNVFCLKCGQNNHKDAKYCSKCKQALPKIFKDVTEYTDISGESEQPAEEKEEFRNIIKMRNLTEDVVEGNTDAKELTAFIIKMKELYSGALNYFENLEKSEKNLYPEIVQNIRSSIKIINEFNNYFDQMITLSEMNKSDSIISMISHIEDLAEELSALRKNFSEISKSLANNPK